MYFLIFDNTKYTIVRPQCTAPFFISEIFHRLIIKIIQFFHPLFCWPVRSTEVPIRSRCRSIQRTKVLSKFKQLKRTFCDNHFNFFHFKIISKTIRYLCLFILFPPDLFIVSLDVRTKSTGFKEEITKEYHTRIYFLLLKNRLINQTFAVK